MKHIIYHNGNPVKQEPILIENVPIGKTFGMLSADWMGPTRSQYGTPGVGLQEGEEHYYKVVLSTYIRTENGYVSTIGGQEYPLKPYWAILL